jgi:hypothetical protein
MNGPHLYMSLERDPNLMNSQIGPDGPEICFAGGLVDPYYNVRLGGSIGLIKLK